MFQGKLRHTLASDLSYTELEQRADTTTTWSAPRCCDSFYTGSVAGLDAR